MRPSNTVVSDLLTELHCAAIDIEECLLIGEKVTMIYEAGVIYNQLRELITSDYYMDDEYRWVKELGNQWNAEVHRYRNSMGASLEEGHQENLEELENQIRDALEDLLGPSIDLGIDDDDDLD